MQVHCPHCRSPMHVAADGVPGRLHCSACGAGFVRSSSEILTIVPDNSDDTVTYVRSDSAATAVDSSVARRFGDYELLEEVARGGMGVVYRAKQLTLNRVVALKMIKAGELASAEDVRRFQAEAEAAANLDHPGIVPVYEVGEQEGRHFFSMGFVEGCSLQERLQDGPLPPEQAAKLVRTVAEAIAYAHQRGVIHRDLKPGNVLMDVAGNPRVTDFGLAKRSDSASDITATGQVIGTPGYMPPEQATGRVGQVGPLSDVYSLGALLYALLTGRPPFSAASRVDTLRQVIERDATPLRLLNPAIDRDLETICLKCLEKQPAQRYGSAADLVAELNRYLDGKPITARPVGRLQRVLRWAKRHPARAGLALSAPIAVIALVAFPIGLGVQQSLREAYNREQSEREHAETARKEADAARDAESIQRTRAEGLSEQLDQSLYFQRVASAFGYWKDDNVEAARRLLDECPIERRGWEWHYLYRLCHAEVLTLRDDRLTGRALALSPDGTHIAAGSHDGIIIWDEKTGRKLQTVGKESVISVAYSPDGKWIAGAEGTGRVSLWDTGTGRLARTIDIRDDKSGASNAISIAFSRDGRQIATARGERRLSHVKVWNVDDGSLALKLTGAHSAWVRSIAYGPNGKYLATAGDDGLVKLWDARSGRKLRTLKGHTHWVLSVAFSPDGKRLVSGGRDRTVRIWQVKDGRALRTLTGHRGPVRSVAFGPAGAWVFAAGNDKTIRVWDHLGNQIFALRGHTQGVYAIAMHPKHRRVASVGADKTVRRWSAEWDPRARVLQRPTQLGDVAISPNGRQFATRSLDGTMTLWATKQRNRLQVWSRIAARELKTRALHIVYSQDSKRIAGIEPNAVRIWNTATGKTIRVHSQPFGALWQLKGAVFHPDGVRVAGSSYRLKQCKVWNAASGKELLSIEGVAQRVSFSPDGELVARMSDANDERQTVRIFHIASGRQVHALSGHQGNVRRVVFGPTGRIATVSGATVTLWDSKTGRRQLQFTAGHYGVRDVAFSPDGRRIAVAAGETVQIWDPRTGQRAFIIHGFAAPGSNAPGDVSGVAFTPDGKTLVSVGFDKTVRIWSAVSGRWSAANPPKPRD